MPNIHTDRYRNVITFFSVLTFFSRRSHSPPSRSGSSREGANLHGKCRGIIFIYRYVTLLLESASQIIFGFWILGLSLAHRVRIGIAVKRSRSHLAYSCARYTVEKSYCVYDTRKLRIHAFGVGTTFFLIENQCDERAKMISLPPRGCAE